MKEEGDSHISELSFMPSELTRTHRVALLIVHMIQDMQYQRLQKTLSLNLKQIWVSEVLL